MSGTMSLCQTVHLGPLSEGKVSSRPVRNIQPQPKSLGTWGVYFNELVTSISHGNIWKLKLKWTF